MAPVYFAKRREVMQLVVKTSRLETRTIQDLVWITRMEYKKSQIDRWLYGLRAPVFGPILCIVVIIVLVFVSSE